MRENFILDQFKSVNLSFLFILTKKVTLSKILSVSFLGAERKLYQSAAKHTTNSQRKRCEIRCSEILIQFQPFLSNLF